nr:unnamed protein product [Naegleria fowleri]
MRETKGSEAKTKARAKNNSQIIQEFECDTTTYKAMKTCKKCRLVLIRLPSEISSINEELNVYISAEHYTVLPDGGSKNSDEKDDLNSTDLDKERKRKLVEGKKPLSSKKTKIDDDEDAGDSTDEEVQNDDILPEIDETKIPNPYQDFIRRYKKALEKNVIKKERMKQEHYQEIDKFRNQIKDLEKKNKQLTKSCVKFARTIEKLTTQIAMYNSKITTPAEAPTSGQEILNTLSTAPSSVSSNIPTTEVAHNELHVDDDLTFFNDYDLDWSNFNDGKSAQPSHDLNKNDDESDLDLFETIHRN